MSDLPPPPGSPPPPPPPGAYPPPPPGAFAPPTYGTGEYGYATPATATPAIGTPAGFGLRLGGWLIDAFIYAALLVPAIIYLANGPTHVVPSDESTFCQAEEFALCEEPTDGTVAGALGIGLAGGVAGIVYRTVLEARSGQTLGKRAVGIRVVDSATGVPIGGGRALGRAVLAWVMFMACFVAYFLSVLWPLWDTKRQTLHDKAVGAAVVVR